MPFWNDYLYKVFYLEYRLSKGRCLLKTTPDRWNGYVSRSKIIQKENKIARNIDI